ncbi:hypothetical protein [Leptospira bandrabouensis]|nr:hypothetical protein [Leptospira bandrabouensis]
MKLDFDLILYLEVANFILMIRISKQKPNLAFELNIELDLV